jgi:uncharacterized integral membrane protein
MQISFEYAKADFRAIARASIGRRGLLLLLIVLAALAYVVVSSSFNPWSIRLAAIVIILDCVLAFVLLPLYVQFRLSHNPHFAGKVIWNISETQLRITTGGGESSHNKGTFSRMYETSTCVLLRFRGSTSVVAIPKRALGSMEDVSEFRKLSRALIG